MRLKIYCLLFSLLTVLSLGSCTYRSNLYEITDQFVESLNSTYESYGLIGGMDEIQISEDGKYEVFPIGRLVNVKILEEASDTEYENLRKDLESHYKYDSRVNKVYRCNAGTLMIDCRR